MSNVSLQHEAPLGVLREVPDVVLDLLRLVGHPIVGEHLTAKVVDSALTEPVPSARKADLVSVIEDEDGRAQHVVVVEVQRRRNEKKIRAWPLYVAYLAASYGVNVTLLVIAFNQRVAEWVRRPRSYGPNLAFTPLVIGPDELPEIRSTEDALAHPELAVLTALCRLELPSEPPHLEREKAEVLRIYEAFLGSKDSVLRSTYVSWIHGTASGAFRATLKSLAQEYGMRLNELIFEKGKAEGEAHGRAEALLKVLRGRGIDVDTATEQRVRATTDIAELDAWLDRASEATRLEDVFQA